MEIIDIMLININIFLFIIMELLLVIQFSTDE